MITVACVYRTGGDYIPEYVQALRAGVKKYLTVPHHFVCLTDDPRAFDIRGVLGIPFKHFFRGWWSKVELFYLVGPVLYFDLDTIICGSLDELARQVEEFNPNDFMMLRDLYHGRPWKLTSGVMAWNGVWQWIVDKFVRSPVIYQSRFRGDQEYIETEIKGYVGEARVVQNSISVASWKWNCRRLAPPMGTSIVCFHGQPRPLDEWKRGSAWVKENWRF